MTAPRRPMGDRGACFIRSCVPDRRVGMDEAMADSHHLHEVQPGMRSVRSGSWWRGHAAAVAGWRA